MVLRRPALLDKSEPPLASFMEREAMAPPFSKKLFSTQLLAAFIIFALIILSATDFKNVSHSPTRNTYEGAPKGTFLRLKDCSSGYLGDNHSLLWNTDSLHMNGTGRAVTAVEILKLKGVISDTPSSQNPVIVDIGAGFQAIRSILPANVEYIPVDFEERVPGSETVLCNLNDGSFPFVLDKKVSVFLFLGSFEYILDKVTALRACRQRNAPVLLHYQLGKTYEGKQFQWVAPLTVRTFSKAAVHAGFGSIEFYRNLSFLRAGFQVGLDHRGSAFVYLGL